MLKHSDGWHSYDLHLQPTFTVELSDDAKHIARLMYEDKVFGIECVYMSETIKNWTVEPYCREGEEMDTKMYQTFCYLYDPIFTEEPGQAHMLQQFSDWLRIQEDVYCACKEQTKRSFRKKMVSDLGLNWKKLKTVVEAAGLEDRSWRIDQDHTDYPIAFKWNMRWQDKDNLEKIITGLPYIQNGRWEAGTRIQCPFDKLKEFIDDLEKIKLLM